MNCRKEHSVVTWRDAGQLCIGGPMLVTFRLLHKHLQNSLRHTIIVMDKKTKKIFDSNIYCVTFRVFHVRQVVPLFVETLEVLVVQ